MVEKLREFTLTESLLREYAAAALENASSLLEEATLLLKHEYYPRSYFLALASIEETGKSMIAFNSLGRNLQDPGIQHKIKKSFEDHQAKIQAAFLPWVQINIKDPEMVWHAAELMVDLLHAREPSMYSEIQDKTSAIRKPRDVVRRESSKECVRLARTLLDQTNEHFRSSKPTEWDQAADRLYLTKSKDINAILLNENFHWYRVERLEAGDKNDVASMINTYKREYYDKGMQYERVTDNEGNRIR